MISAVRARAQLAPVHFVPLLGLCVGIVATFHPTLRSGLALIQTDPGDTRLNNYILEHSYRWLTGWPGYERLWDPRFFFPEPNVGAYTDSLLTVAPLYWGWRLLGLAPDTTFQLWMIVVTILNFASFYLLLRQGVGASVPAATVGAMLFACGSPRVAQLQHQQLVPQFFTVGAVFGIVRLFQAHPSSGRCGACWRWIAMLGLSTVLQLYAGFYLGWFLLLSLAIACLWALVLPELRCQLVRLLRVHYRATVLVGLGSILLLAPLAGHYLQAYFRVGPRNLADIMILLPTPASWLYMGRESWLYGWTQDLPIFRGIQVLREHRLGLGLVTPTLVIMGLLARRRSPAVKVLVLVSATLIAVSTTFVEGLLPWQVVFNFVPASNAIRAVCRIGLMLLIPAGLGLAFWVDRFSRHRWVVLAAVAFSLLEQGRTTRAYDKAVIRSDVESLAQAVPRGCEVIFASFASAGRTPAWPAPKYQLDAMWAALELGLPTVNGYSGNRPPGWSLGQVGRTRSDEELLRAAFDAWTQQEAFAGLETCVVESNARDR